MAVIGRHTVLINKQPHNDICCVCNLIDFFHNILIPPECLPQESVFNPSEQVWVWKYKVEEETHDLYMDAGEEIRFKITKEQFVDIAADVNKAGGEIVPYMLYAQVSDAGLGLLSWWN